MSKVTREELNAFAAHWNKKKAESGLKSDTNLEIFLSMMHSYLFLIRENEYSEEEYATIKNALQDITDWFTIGFDIERFEKVLPNGPFVTERTLIELD